MQKHIRFYVISAVLMLSVPAAAGLRQGNAARQSADASLPAAAAEGMPFRVLRTETGTVEEIPVRDYLIGAVAAEMPARFAPEALKAQAVACRTYAERLRANPDPALGGAVFSDDSAQYQAFLSREQLKLEYGAHFDSYYAIIAEAVDAAGGLLLCYDGAPIAAAFHACSGGYTESAEAVWGQALPYLVPVESPLDAQSPYACEETVLPAETVKRALEAVRPETVLPEDPAQWFTLTEVTPRGTVLHAEAGGVSWTGEGLRAALHLHSARFTVQESDGLLTFTTHGFGHGVGMSQYGADAMARRGSSFSEILLHYYPGAVLCEAPSA